MYIPVRATVHVGGGGARGHRLPRGAGAERAAAVPRGGRAAGRAGVGAVQAERAAPHQARRAGTAPHRRARRECFPRTACLLYVSSFIYTDSDSDSDFEFRTI